VQIIDIFSGIGGFSLAGSWIPNWRTIQFCEIDKLCNRILKYHWPGVPIHTDIKTLTAKQIINNGLYDKEETTILTGGVPCQPWSLAGKRKGEADNRNLWPQTIELIGSVRPDYAVLENVPGLLSWNKGLFFEHICLELETKGYEILPIILPSASIGAWDKRDRVWIIAHNGLFRQAINEKQTMGGEQCNKKSAHIAKSGVGELSIQQRRQNKTKDINPDREIKINPDINKFDSDNAGLNSGTISQQQTPGIQINNDTVSKRLQGYSWNDLSSRQKEQARQAGQANWLRDWIEVASELCGSNARVPHRMDRIKGLGNSVNPYVPFQIFKAINNFQNSCI